MPRGLVGASLLRGISGPGEDFVCVIVALPLDLGRHVGRALGERPVGEVLTSAGRVLLFGGD